MAARRCVTGDILVEVMKVLKLFGTGHTVAKERLSSFWNLNLSADARPASGLSLKFQNYKGYRLQAVSGQN